MKKKSGNIGHTENIKWLTANLADNRQSIDDNNYIDFSWKVGPKVVFLKCQSRIHLVNFKDNESLTLLQTVAF